MDSSNLTEAFERAVVALPHEQEFRNVEIVTHHARRYGATVAFSLTVDRPGGVDVELCAGVSRRLNRALDAFDEPYTLEVESAGLERPLQRPADYERFRERNVRVITKELIDGRKTHRGRLTGVKGMSVMLEAEGKPIAIPIDLIGSANLEYDPRNDLRRAKQEKQEKRKHDQHN
jgi:ribosome maturation factor RimP